MMSNKLRTKVVVAVVIALLAYLFFMVGEDATPEPVAQQEKTQKVHDIEITNKIKIADPVVATKNLQQPQKIAIAIPKLKIKVQGIFPGKNKNSGYALIAYNGGSQQVYIIGASLSEGVLLKSLSVRGVIIDNHGRLEKYPLRVIKKANKQITPSLPEVKKENLQSDSTLSRDRQPRDELLMDGPPMDGSVPPPAPPREPAKPQEYIPPPPSGGIMPQ